MQWLKVDSLQANHPKILAIDDGPAKLLWYELLSICSEHETDGRAAQHMIKRAGLNAYLTTPGPLRKAVRRLVATGLFHDHTTVGSCDPCVAEFGEVAPGEVVAHNWSDANPVKADKTDETRAFKANRKRQLKKLAALKEAIRRRDRDYCRYCGVRVNMNDRITVDGGQLDHVDPDGPNSMENLVRSCRGCNMHRKGERTPTEAGMVMLPPPSAGVAPPIPEWRLGDDPFGLDPGNTPKYPTVDGASKDIEKQRPNPGPNPRSNQSPTRDRPPENPRSNPGPPSRSARVGSEPGRTRVEPRVGTGSGPGSGSALPGPVRLGMGQIGSVGAGVGLLGAARAGAGSVPPSPPAPPPPGHDSSSVDPVELVEQAFHINPEESEIP